MRSLSVLLLLGCSACAQQAVPECHNYQLPITVGSTQVQADFTACRQADNSWRITQTTPGLPSQIYVVPPYAVDPRMSQ
ncbi:MAG: hypothetical protein JOY64_13620 [Alphaproteobacteria bacterium]|nr:hypothetical protein [Alphaproteobacteria bacterium]MBV8408669.1 hypothetical protein [Alphaproteobacteria bacterium]